jgi:hypothetical protein
MPGHGIAVFEDVPTSGLPINVPNGVCGLNGLAQVAAPQLALAVLDADVGVAGGVASLDGGGKVPASQLSGSAFTLAGIALTTGDVGVGALAAIPGTLIAFTVTTTGPCLFGITGVWGGSTPIPAINLGIRIDGATDYLLAADTRINGSGGDTDLAISQSGNITLPIVAGAHTVQIIASQGGFPGFVLNANPTYPLTISVLYP